MARLWAIALLTVGVVVACDRVPLTSPTGSTIALSVDRDTLPLNGQATVTAVVTEVSGTAVQNGTLVTFQTSLGRTDPIEAETTNGKASVTFLAGSSSGVAVIQAFSGPARTGSGNSTAGGVSVKVGTAGTERVTVRTEPLSVPVSGGTVTVVGAIFDAAGNPIANTPVSFSSDFGTLSANSATTDGNGEARVQLTTNRTTKVTVTAGAKTGDFTLNALVPPTVKLACGTGTTANVGNVGVPVGCTISPSVSGNGSSSAPIQNVTINWGDGSGEQPLGAVTGDTVVLHTYASPGTFQVVGAATDANSQRGQAIVTLNITRSIPSISITGPATGAVGVPVTFVVTFPNAATIPTQSVSVNFGDGTSRDLGVISGQTNVFKTFTSAGTYTVSATITDIAGGRNTTSTVILIQAAAAPTVTLSLDSGAAHVNAVSAFTVGATTGQGLTITNIRVTLQDGSVLYNGGPGSFTWTPGSVGTATITATATDSAGNTGTRILIVPVS